MSHLKEWEKRKLKEVTQYASDAEGTQVNLRKFRDRIKQFSKKLVEHKQGMAPFVYGGKKPDYYPEMMESELDKFDVEKEIYMRNRVSHVLE